MSSSESEDSETDCDIDADRLYSDMVVGDIVKAYVENADITFLMFITGVERYARPKGSKNKVPLYIVDLQDMQTSCVYKQQMQLGDPFIITLGDSFMRGDLFGRSNTTLSTKPDLSQIGMGPSATWNDKLAKHEAYMDLQVSAISEFKGRKLRNRFIKTD